MFDFPGRNTLSYASLPVAKQNDFIVFLLWSIALSNTLFKSYVSGEGDSK